MGGCISSFSSPQCVTWDYSRAQFSDLDSFLSMLTPKRILSKLTILNTIYTLKTLKYLCPDWTSPPSPKVKYPTAYSTPPPGGLIAIFNFTRTTPSTCSSLHLLHLSKQQVHPSNCSSTKREAFMIPLLLHTYRIGNPSENPVGSIFKSCPESDQVLTTVTTPTLAWTTTISCHVIKYSSPSCSPALAKQEE